VGGSLLVAAAHPVQIAPAPVFMAPSDRLQSLQASVAATMNFAQMQTKDACMIGNKFYEL